MYCSSRNTNAVNAITFVDHDRQTNGILFDSNSIKYKIAQFCHLELLATLFLWLVRGNVV
jgi:hypothetical protein